MLGSSSNAQLVHFAESTLEEFVQLQKDFAGLGTSSASHDDCPFVRA